MLGGSRGISRNRGELIGKELGQITQSLNLVAVNEDPWVLSPSCIQCDIQTGSVT